MAIRISSPEFSFVRFSDQNLNAPDWLENQIPGAELGFYLPINSPTDLAFQVLVETDTLAEADDICGISGDMGFIVAYMGSDLVNPLSYAAMQAALVTDGTTAESFNMLGASRFRISDTEIVYYFPRVTFLPTDTCGQCYQFIFALSLQFETVGGQAVSNIFVNNCQDTDFTTVLNYFSVRDEVGFRYCLGPNMKNRVRLPLYLCKPTFPKDEDLLRLSNNKVVIRKSIVRKVYQVTTDQFPAWAIECLKAVFLHDEVFTDIAHDMPTTQVIPYMGEIVEDGTFEPAYLEYKNFPLAPVNFKVNAVDFVMIKNNCGLCGDYSAMFTVTNFFLNPVNPNSDYQIDLYALTDPGCCMSVLYEIDYYQSNYISSIHIDQSSGVAGNHAHLNLHTAGSMVNDPAHRPPFIRVKATCGGISKFILITTALA